MSLAEVAKIAGVSTATVSRVLRRSSQVRPETAAQVARAMEAVGFTPSGLRRSAGRERRRKAGSPDCRIAIIAVGNTMRRCLHVPALASFIAAVTETARSHEFSVLLDELPRLGAKNRLIDGGEIGGAILLVDPHLAMAPETSQLLLELSSRLPLVWAMGSHGGSLIVDRVAADGQGGGQLAASYLADRGCSRIALVATQPRLFSVRTSASGFVSAAYDRGLETTIYVVSADPRDKQLFSGQVVLVPSLEACVEKAALRGNRPHGIFIPNDDLTSQLYPLLARAGLRPGQDVQCASCDTDSCRPHAVHPKPTAVAVNTSEIARRSLRRLQSRMDRPSEDPVLIQVPPILIRSQEMERLAVPPASLVGSQID